MMLEKIRKINPGKLKDIGGLQKAVEILINAVEDLAQENAKLKEDNQQLQDENARLKGGNARPVMKGKKMPATDISSGGKEKGRRKAVQVKNKGPRSIEVDHDIKVEKNKKELPPDAIFKGYDPYCQQDLEIRRNNKLSPQLEVTKQKLQKSENLLNHTSLNINMDQIGSSIDNTLFASGTRLYPKLRSLIVSVDTTEHIAIAFGHDDSVEKDNWINQSDQGPFNEAHIPFIYFSANENVDPSEPERIDPDFFYPAVKDILKATINLDKYMDVHLSPKNKWIMRGNSHGSVSR